MSSFTENFIRVNEYTRPGIKLSGVRKLIIHYTATPGATKENERAYFNGTCITAKRYASAHIFVDKNGAVNIIPLNEVAYAANDVQKRNANGTPYRGVPEIAPNANFYTVSVELCVEKDWTFDEKTVTNAVNVFAELCKKFHLNEEDIVRHYDVTAKNCPAPFVSNPEAFKEFKLRVGAKLRGNVVKKTVTAVKKTVAKVTKKAVIKKVYLPKAATTWAVYPTNKAPIKANAKGYLAPAKFGGLSYEILSTPQKNVVTIKTSSFGKVNIYVAPSTGATIK